MGQCLAPMCIAATEGFFHAAHRTEKGAGRLLVLAASPQACTGCGICAVACEDGAITMENKAVIHAHQCTACGNCVLACPSEAISLVATPAHGDVE